MNEWEMYEVLEEMRIPVIECPEDIMGIMNERREVIASVQDPRVANELMVGVAQFMMYARQQYNIYRAACSRMKRIFEQKLAVAAYSIDGKSLAERKSLALELNDDLKLLQEDLYEMELKRDLIEDWIDDCKEFLNALKRIHDDLMEEKMNHYRTNN